MATEQDSPKPLDVSCLDLDGLRAQARDLGYLVINNRRPLTAARAVIADSILPSGDKVLKSPDGSDLIIPTTDDPAHQQLIREARAEASRAECWWRQVGSVAALSETGEIVARAYNRPPEGGDFCRSLSIPNEEVLKLLNTGERLEFCPGKHSELGLAFQIARMNIPPGTFDVAVSLEPCDPCAYALIEVRPRAVYIPDRKYYSSLGLKLLQAESIPTYIVRMPGE